MTIKMYCNRYRHRNCQMENINIEIHNVLSHCICFKRTMRSLKVYLYFYSVCICKAYFSPPKAMEEFRFRCKARLGECSTLLKGDKCLPFIILGDCTAWSISIFIINSQQQQQKPCITFNYITLSQLHSSTKRILIYERIVIV